LKRPAPLPCWGALGRPTGRLTPTLRPRTAAEPALRRLAGAGFATTGSERLQVGPMGRGRDRFTRPRPSVRSGPRRCRPVPGLECPGDPCRLGRAAPAPPQHRHRSCQQLTHRSIMIRSSRWGGWDLAGPDPGWSAPRNQRQCGALTDAGPCWACPPGAGPGPRATRTRSVLRPHTQPAHATLGMSAAPLAFWISSCAAGSVRPTTSSTSPILLWAHKFAGLFRSGILY
jgi:hypothetical protein